MDGSNLRSMKNVAGEPATSMTVQLDSYSLTQKYSGSENSKVQFSIV